MQFSVLHCALQSLSDPTAELIKTRGLQLMAGRAPSPSCLALTALMLVCCLGQIKFCVPHLAVHKLRKASGAVAGSSWW